MQNSRNNTEVVLPYILKSRITRLFFVAVFSAHLYIVLFPGICARGSKTNRTDSENGLCGKKPKSLFFNRRIIGEPRNIINADLI